jgi:hypothetical protein
MRRILVPILLLMTATSFANERAAIQQMKGRRAVIVFENDIPFSVGQKVYLQSEDGVELGVRKDIRNHLQRKNSIQLSASLDSTNTKPDETTASSLAVRYGLNYENFELGPLVSLSSTKASSQMNLYKFGGFFDFNFVPNRAGEDLVYGVFAEASSANAKTGSISTTTTSLGGGAFIKWFVLSPVLAIRLNAYYRNDKPNNSKGTNTTGIGFALEHYF